MKSSILSRSLLFSACLSAASAVWAQDIPEQAEASLQPAPTCTANDLVGAWKNDIGYTVRINSVEPLKGTTNGVTFSGIYETPLPTRKGTRKNPFIGTANYAKPQQGVPDNALVLAFMVNWGEYGSVAAWTGTCRINKGRHYIDSIWNLARPNSTYDWDHIHTGWNYFKKQQ